MNDWSALGSYCGTFAFGTFDRQLESRSGRSPEMCTISLAGSNQLLRAVEHLIEMLIKD